MTTEHHNGQQSAETTEQPKKPRSFDQLWDEYTPWIDAFRQGLSVYSEYPPRITEAETLLLVKLSQLGVRAHEMLVDTMNQNGQALTSNMQQEILHLQRLANVGLVAEDILIVGHMRLIRKQVQSYHWKGWEDQQDFIQAAMDGFVRAVRKYDLNKSQFSTTYIVRTIQGYILNENRRIESHIHIPVGKMSIQTVIRNIEEQWLSQGISYTEEEVISETWKRMGVDPSIIISVYRAMHISSLQKDISGPDKEGFTQEQRIEQTMYPDPHRYAEDGERRNYFLHKIQELLSPVHQYVLLLRYGFVDGKCYKFKEIVDILPRLSSDPKISKKRSKQRIAQIHDEAMRTIKQKLPRNPFT